MFDTRCYSIGHGSRACCVGVTLDKLAALRGAPILSLFASGTTVGYFLTGETFPKATMLKLLIVLHH
uniref:Uncharacterized protein n=1 Tax=Anopheles quadriannulatus TaxID=34691 RepID=A0A182XRI9_ANOQN